MKWTSIVSIYTLFWVLSCFLVMPFGIRTHADVAGTAEEVERVSGQVDSAPINFNPRRTALRGGTEPAHRPPGGLVGQADMAHLARAHQPRQRLQLIVDGADLRVARRRGCAPGAGPVAPQSAGASGCPRSPRTWRAPGGATRLWPLEPGEPASHNQHRGHRAVGYPGPRSANVPTGCAVSTSHSRMGHLMARSLGLARWDLLRPLDMLSSVWSSAAALPPVSSGASRPSMVATRSAASPPRAAPTKKPTWCRS